MHVPQGPFKSVANYEIPINGGPYEMVTLVSSDEVIAWMPDTEQQHVNPQYRDKDSKIPVKLGEVLESDIARMLGQVLLLRTKKVLPLEDILLKHGILVGKILDDFRTYNLRHINPSSLANKIQ